MHFSHRRVVTSPRLFEQINPLLGIELFHFEPRKDVPIAKLGVTKSLRARVMTSDRPPVGLVAELVLSKNWVNK